MNGADKLKEKMKIETLGSILGNPESTGKTVVSLPTNSMHRFSVGEYGHTFKIPADEVFQGTIDSVAENGVIQPAVVRSREGGGYEIIAGHRRHRACELAGIDCPAIIEDLDDDEAIIRMVDSNKSRSDWSVRERAFSYKALYDALRRKAGRPSVNYVQSEHNLETPTARAELARKIGDTEANVQRYLRLVELIPPLLEMVDKDEIKLIPAVYISYLDKDIEQTDLLRAIESGYMPTVAQAKELKRVSETEGLTPEMMFKILREEDRTHEHYNIPSGSVKKYFPKDYNEKQIKQKIVEIIAEWYKNQQLKKEAEQDNER